MVKKFLQILILIFCFVNSGCGVYGFRGNNPPPGISSISVPVFQDESGFSDPTLADRLTQQLKTKIIVDNTFRIADKNIADAILKCNIVSVRDEALVVSADDNVAKRKVTVTVNVVFENLKQQKNLWNKNFENFGEYNSSNIDFSKQELGIQVATERITDDIVIDLTSNW